jgi:hypothetical protein
MYFSNIKTINMSNVYIYLFPGEKEQPIVDVESSIMLGDSLFFLASFLLTTKIQAF